VGAVEEDPDDVGASADFFTAVRAPERPPSQLDQLAAWYASMTDFGMRPRSLTQGVGKVAVSRR
jgi:hypothetical protein